MSSPSTFRRFITFAISFVSFKTYFLIFFPTFACNAIFCNYYGYYFKGTCSAVALFLVGMVVLGFVGTFVYLVYELVSSKYCQCPFLICVPDNYLFRFIRWFFGRCGSLINKLRNPVDREAMKAEIRNMNE